MGLSEIPRLVHSLAATADPSERMQLAERVRVAADEHPLDHPPQAPKLAEYEQPPYCALLSMVGLIETPRPVHSLAATAVPSERIQVADRERVAEAEQALDHPLQLPKAVEYEQPPYWLEDSVVGISEIPRLVHSELATVVPSERRQVAERVRNALDEQVLDQLPQAPKSAE